MVETIKNALSSDQNIVPEFEENLLELVEIINKKLPEVDLSNLAERLETLSIKHVSMYLIKRPCQYNAGNNEILINKNKAEESDIKHWVMRALVSMIAAKENYSGFDNSEHELNALNEGLIEQITNCLIGEEQTVIDNNESNYFTETIVINNLVEKLIGADKLYDAYFTNDSTLIQQVVSKEILDKLNMNLELLDSDRPYDPFETITLMIKNHPELINNLYQIPLNKEYFRGKANEENVERYVAELSALRDQVNTFEEAKTNQEEIEQGKSLKAA